MTRIYIYISHWRKCNARLTDTLNAFYYSQYRYQSICLSVTKSLKLIMVYIYHYIPLRIDTRVDGLFSKSVILVIYISF